MNGLAARGLLPITGRVGENAGLAKRSPKAAHMDHERGRFLARAFAHQANLDPIAFNEVFTPIAEQHARVFKLLAHSQ